MMRCPVRRNATTATNVQADTPTSAPNATGWEAPSGSHMGCTPSLSIRAITSRNVRT